MKKRILKEPHVKPLIWTKPKANGDLIITIGYEKVNGSVGYMSYRGSSTVWRYLDGDRCPAWLEDELSVIYTKWKWRRDDNL